MSALLMRCLHCHGKFISGVVGSRTWPRHTCGDGTRNAPAEYISLDEWNADASRVEDTPPTQETEN